MNQRTIRSMRTSIIEIVFVIFLPVSASTLEPQVGTEPTGSSVVKSLGGSFVVFDSAAGGQPCWVPSTTQTFCFRADSFTDDWEWVENLWLLLPSDWSVVDVAVVGSPFCTNGSWDPFSWTFHTPSHEVNIEHRRNMSGTDHCTAVYCANVMTGAGGNDAQVSWYWDGDDFGDPPHWPCSDDGYTPSGQSACDDSALPRAVIPDCSSFGTLEGVILDFVTTGPTCTEASATMVPGGVAAWTDPSGAYGPVYLEEGPYDVTASALGFEDLTATGVSVLAGATTIQEFDLMRPVVDVTPASIDTSITVGSSGHRTIVLDNLGADPRLEWTLRELPPMEVMSPLSGPPTPGPVKIEPELDVKMKSRGEAAFIIDFRERPDLSPAFAMDWYERGRFVVDALTATAERTQARVRDYLDLNRVAYQAFWIDNVIVASPATREVLEGLLAFEEIEILRADRVLGLIEPVEREPSFSKGRTIETNLSHILADQVWSMGFAGYGIVVANMDTGVRYSHEVLESHYRGTLGSGTFDHDYNWLDGVDGSSMAPHDDHGHGSHTMGIMVGDDGGANQVGMAPGATWIACDACEGTGCPSNALLTCAQWTAAPYPIGDPNSPDPSKRPHVVNNSWGDCDTSYDNWFQGSVDSWHAAGIYPVFSNGNAGNCAYPAPPGCNTVGNPGRYGNVTGVGSTGQSDGVYAAHSNWGPTDNLDTVNPNGFPNLKPQVVAPGVDIRSSLNGSDSAYGSWDGTSMSAPHVSGLVALMWQAAPCLIGDYTLTETIIQKSVAPMAYASDCGGEGPGNIPNMASGWGEIDALEAVTQATMFCNTDWLPWVSGAPDGGQVVAGGSEEITVTFTCGPELAEETGALRLVTDDPCDETIDIPLVLQCTYAGDVDLAISKSDGVATATPGTPLMYTIGVSNDGPSDAVGAAVTDSFVALLTDVGWSCGGSGGASCTATGSGSIADTVIVPVGGSVTYTVNAILDPSGSGTLSNTATVTAPPGAVDLDPIDNSATDTTLLTPEVDLGVSKTDGLSSLTPGDPITYTISVANAGPSNAPGAVVSDSFPAAVNGVAWSCVASGGASCAVAGAGDINDIVSLPVGGSLVYTATGTVSAAATGTLSNTATVAPPPGVTDTNPNNNSATDITVLIPVVDLAITKSDGVASAVPGESVTYVITVSNGGPHDAVGAVVADSFPGELGNVVWTCEASSGAVCTASGSGDIADTVTVPVGGTVTYTVTADIDPGALGEVENTAGVQPSTGAADPEPSNNVATDTDILTPVTELHGYLNNRVCWLWPGESTTYTLAVVNDGPSDAMGTMVADSPPTILTGVTWTCSAVGGASCPASGTGVINETVGLPAGGSVEFLLSGTIDPGAFGWLINEAYAAPPAGAVDPTPRNAAFTDWDALEPPELCDGFEAGDTGGWTSTTPG